MLDESAPEDLEGSFARSLILSKLWMCRQLKKTMHALGIHEFEKVYSLGSWYGNMALFMITSHVPFKIMVDVDINPVYLATSRRLFPRLHATGKLISLHGDCNRLRYSLSQPSLVINNSTNNMAMDGWLDRIPSGTLVAMQGRDNEPQNGMNKAQTIGSFDARFPLSDTLFLGSLALRDPGDRYNRFMKIGIK